MVRRCCLLCMNSGPRSREPGRFNAGIQNEAQAAQWPRLRIIAGWSQKRHISLGTSTVHFRHSSTPTFTMAARSARSALAFFLAASVAEDSIAWIWTCSPHHFSRHASFLVQLGSIISGYGLISIKPYLGSNSSFLIS